ncbi:MAG: tetratricopeptide repeat protein, partial [Candidatus Lokiarchaeota archaeon]
MTEEELEQLTRAEKFFDAGNLDDAYSLLKNLMEDYELEFDKKVYIQYLSSLICVYQQKSEEVIEIGKDISSEAQKLKHDLFLIDGLYLILMGLIISDKFEKTSDILEEADAILKTISDISENDLKLRRSRIILIKAWIAFHTGKIKEAEKMIQTSLNLMKDLDDNLEKAWAYLLLAQIFIQIKSKFDLSMEYSEKALSIAKNIRFNDYWIGYSYIGIAVSYGLIYEYDLSLEYHKKSLEIFQKLDNKWYICVILNNMGLTYCEKGDYNLSMKYLEESLTLWEQYSLTIGALLDSLVYVARIRDMAKAEKLFKQIAQAENSFFDYRLYAYIHLCDMLLAEFRLNYENEVLKELEEFIPKLLSMAEETHSYLVFCETFILQAKLALLHLDLNFARRFLTQAQKIAESKGIKRLAIKISYEHDKLIEQMKLWNSLKDSETPISERWKLAGLNEQMEIMKRKGLGEVPDISDEKPIFLLIVSEGGVPILSQSFTSETSFQDHLFGGFFTTINSFITENFSEGLNRASFGKYTLLMNAFSPFLMCYIYKGQSYSAQKRINSFLNKI